MPAPGPPRLLYGATFELIAGPTKPITGVVRTKGTGRPSQGSTSGDRAATWTWISATDRPDGRFRLARPAQGRGVSGPHRCPVGRRAVPHAPRLTVSDTEGLKPIETTHRGPQRA